MSCYLLYYLAEYKPLKISGVTSIITLGLYMKNTDRAVCSSLSEKNTLLYIRYICETVIFIVSGIVMGQRMTVD